MRFIRSYPCPQKGAGDYQVTIFELEKTQGFTFHIGGGRDTGAFYAQKDGSPFVSWKQAEEIANAKKPENITSQDFQVLSFMEDE